MHRDQPIRARRRRFDDDDAAYEAADHDYFRSFFSDDDGPAVSMDGPPEGDRWSTWDDSERGERGPEPYPDWLVTEKAAVDRELGILKTGKEADVYLIERFVPGTERSCLLAAKRYRDTKHRMFRRDDDYTAGRRDAESRVNRAIAKRTAFGASVIAAKWVSAEFVALRRLFETGVAVPYPVQVLGSEVLMEYIGDDDGTAAPRLAALRPDPATLTDLWDQLRHNMSLMALDGFTHGDLSPYNLIVQEGRLVVIDVPQIIDVVANPRGREFLLRDIRNVGDWFVARGLPEAKVDRLTADLLRDARLPT
ncbi:serine protein kinase RIO [Stackebrandtia soli]|uniref:serine protein kinase RIO n=1 Tax=Stackebrandtia soli TaxID=1892856 RepID=UPI0039E96919